MSLSNEYTEWHLTPRGWESGTEKVDFGATTEKPAPPDRVKTCTYREKQSSSFSKMQRWVEENWECEDKTAVQALLAKYGPCPNHL